MTMWTNIANKLQSTQKNLRAAFKLVFAAVFLAILVIPVYPAAAGDDGSSYRSADDYYKAQSNIQIESKIENIIKGQDGKVYVADRTLGDIQNELENLRDAANGEIIVKLGQAKISTTAEGQYKGQILGADSKMEDVIEDLQDAINEALKKKQISESDAKLIMEEGRRLYEVGLSRAIQAFKAGGGDKDGETEQELLAERQETLKAENLRVGRECATVDELRQKYQSGGCWSCLVVEKLVSAFLTVAGKAYGLAQKAGLIVLGIGAVMWLLIWGLKNVSSLTQLMPGNILNDLIKFFFKVALAYIFITSGLKAVSTYFINPLMGTGAVIAQQFWDPETIKPFTQDYSWDDITDEQYAEIAQVEQQAIAETQKTPVPTPSTTQQQETQTRIYSEEEKRLLEEAEKNAKNFAEEEIPNFIIPPVFEGHLTSPVGCRVPPVPGASKYHMGLDIGTYGKQGGAVVASGPGTITYRVQTSGGKVTGAGYYAIIVHSPKWTTRYFHMLPNSQSSFGPSGRKVKQGEQIGYIGNTGTGSGAHLHFEVKYKGQNVEPLSLLQKKIILINKNSCSGKNITPFPDGFSKGMNVPTSPQAAWTSGGKGVIDLSSTYVSTNGGSGGGSSGSAAPSDMVFSSLILDKAVGDVTYTGPTNIMSKSVMNSILGATKAITNITSENMVLGNAITCYATLEEGGAWKIEEWFGWFKTYITNAVMWLEGILIWCTGFLLTIAVAYYLLDICFKIGFAVIAMPIVVGLWPFGMTKGKFTSCLSIILKASATFAFLAITSYYAMRLISAGLEGTPTTTYGMDEQSGKTGYGLEELYAAIDTAVMGTEDKAQIELVADRLAVFSISFIILLFCFIYAFKLIGSTTSVFVNKFFPDKVFGNASPMHNWSTATTKWIKDQAMRPVSLGRDIALHQTGRLAKNTFSRAVGLIRGGKSGGSGSPAGNAMQRGGQAVQDGAETVKGAAQGAKTISQATSKAGAGLRSASQAANAIPVAGQVIAGAGAVAGTAVEAAGKVGEAASEAAIQAAEAAKKAGKAMEKTGEKINQASDAVNPPAKDGSKNGSKDGSKEPPK